MGNEGFSLYEELEDGTVDDIAGYGSWHLEKMSEGYFSFVATDDQNEVTGWFTVTAEDGDVVVKVDGIDNVTF